MLRHAGGFVLSLAFGLLGCGGSTLSQLPSSQAAVPAGQGIVIADLRVRLVGFAFVDPADAKVFTNVKLVGDGQREYSSDIVVAGDQHVLVSSLPPGKYRFVARTREAAVKNITQFGGKIPKPDISFEVMNGQAVCIGEVVLGLYIDQRGREAGIEAEFTARDTCGGILEQVRRTHPSLTAPIATRVAH